MSKFAMKEQCRDSTILVLEKGDERFAEFAVLVRREASAQCQKSISREYVTHIVNATTVLIVAYFDINLQTRSGMKPVPQLCGFVMLTDVEEPTAIFLQLICSLHGQGSNLMIALYKYCCENNLRLISLYAIAKVIEFYRRHGFVESVNACDPPKLNGDYELSEYVHRKGLLMSKCISVDFCENLEKSILDGSIRNQIPTERLPGDFVLPDASVHQNVAKAQQALADYVAAQGAQVVQATGVKRPRSEEQAQRRRRNKKFF